MSRRLSALMAASLLVLLGCGPSASQQQDDRQSIERDLETYLPLLGEAYATGDPELLRGGAALKEMARVKKRIRELALQGRVLAPSFQQLTIEDINVWNYANAYVTTLEVWDVRVLASGTGTVLAQEIAQSRRVKYQLKRGQGRWRVLYRAIQE